MERIEISEADACTTWKGKCNSWGYPIFRDKLVSRLIWEYLFGPLQEGEEVMHSCDNPECLNPLHLKAATHKHNMEDMARKGRAMGGVKGRRISNVNA